MTAPPALGRVALDCDACPWPVHLSLLLDVAAFEETGVPLALDAEASGVALALRAHEAGHAFHVGPEI